MDIRRNGAPVPNRRQCVIHRRWAIPALTLAVAVIAGGLSLAAESPYAGRVEVVADEEISAAVEVQLRHEPRVSPHLIDITTADGIVTLSGTVADLLEKQAAVNRTSRVKGVRGIIDRLEVRTADRTDEQIRHDVIEALRADPATESYEVDVRVDEGQVILIGEVDSWAEKLLAADVARSVRGVTGIENEIDVSLDYDRPAGEIKADVLARFRHDPYVDAEHIDVQVQERTVTLSGAVGSLVERDAAVRLAHVGAVENVEHEDLQVAPWAGSDMEDPTRLHRKTDEEIKEAIADVLRHDPRVRRFPIDILVRDGRVWLRGMVDNLAAKRAAGRDAQLSAGVWKVDNEIRVRPEEVSDSVVAERIRTTLARHPTVDLFEIDVDVRNGRAILNGTVTGRYEGMLAERLTEGVRGVAAVQNNLTAIPGREWDWKADDEIREDIQSELQWSPFVDSDELTIRVDDGRVELAGRLAHWHEYRSAVENAFEGGAKTVQSYIHVGRHDKVFDIYWTEPPTEAWIF